MIKKREGEELQSWLRSSRFYSLDGGWYFTTREGIDFGPFPDRNEARKELENYISSTAAGDNNQGSSNSQNC